MVKVKSKCHVSFKVEVQSAEVVSANTKEIIVNELISGRTIDWSLDFL